MSVTLVHVGARFVAADKPSGWLSVPSRMGARDLRPCLGAELTQELGRLWPVHRLDLEVSGLVLFARDPEAHRTANAWFEGHTVHKHYEALTEGDPAGLTRDAPLEWRSQLARGKKRAYEAPFGKLAVTRATWAGGVADRLAWRLEPLTGRPHQLRVHLAQHGYPILGDTLYGARAGLPDGGIMLRAVRLDLRDCASAAQLGLPQALEVSGLAA